MVLSLHLSFWIKSLIHGFRSQFFSPVLVQIQVNRTTLLKIRKNTADEFILWEIWESKLYKHPRVLIAPEDTVLDVGAHIGIFSVFAAKHTPQGKVFAYEPYPSNFELLRENISINDLTNVVSSLQPVTSTAKHVQLNISDSNTGGHSLYRATPQRIMLKSTSLKEIMTKHNLSKIDLIKLDTEGSEYDILFNSPASIIKGVPKWIIEFHDGLAEKHNYRGVIAYLTSMGFKIETRIFFLQYLAFKSGIIFAYK